MPEETVYNGNDPAFLQALDHARVQDVASFANVATVGGEEDEVCLYNDDGSRREEQVIEQVFEDFGNAPEVPQVPLWIQQHNQNVADIENARYQSQSQQKPGLRNLDGPQYHMEKLDPKHRMGDILQALYPVWAYSPDTVRGMAFFEWLDSLSYFEAYKLLKRVKSENFARMFAPAFMKGVAYLDRLSRRHYQVQLNARRNCMMWNSRPLDTAKSETLFSGKGWSAWVLSGSDTFYSGPHIKGEFHHSSFTSGDHVKAAGEWKVTNGRLEYINGKTGHYKCPIDKLVEALQVLQKKIGLSGANVIVWDPKTRKPTEFPAIVFLSNKTMQQEYTSIGQDPLFKPIREQPKMQIGAHRIAK